MKVIVIDRDRDSCDQILDGLAAAGIEAVAAPTRNAAVQMFKEEGGYDAFFMDPVPQVNETRPFIIGLRRSTGLFPPIVIMGNSFTHEEALAVGGNDVLPKPFSNEQLVEKARNAERVVKVAKMMADASEDFPSQDGIIAKSAFSQLFVTCLDRADRYGEPSYLIHVDLDNLDEIAQNDGEPAAREVAENLRKSISRIRRLSDIAGHVGQGRFCLLLLRPSKEDEPFLAANRFAESLRQGLEEIKASATMPVIKVTLLAIPSGAVPLELTINGETDA